MVKHRANFTKKSSSELLECRTFASAVLVGDGPWMAASTSAAALAYGSDVETAPGWDVVRLLRDIRGLSWVVMKRRSVGEHEHEGASRIKTRGRTHWVPFQTADDGAYR